MLHHKNISFTFKDDEIFLKNFGNFKDLDTKFVQVQIAGENKDTHMGIKMVNSSETGKLKYISHTLNENTLVITQQSDLVKTETTFVCYENTNAIRINTKVTNESSESICLEEVSAFCLAGFGDKEQPQDCHLTRFLQSHHAECQPRRQSFKELGLCGGKSDGQQRAFVANIGSWSTKEALPMGILEHTGNANYAMFQIESNNSWYFEV